MPYADEGGRARLHDGGNDIAHDIKIDGGGRGLCLVNPLEMIAGTRIRAQLPRRRIRANDQRACSRSDGFFRPESCRPASGRSISRGFKERVLFRPLFEPLKELDRPPGMMVEIACL